jgi:hypothetical protein
MSRSAIRSMLCRVVERHPVRQAVVVGESGCWDAEQRERPLWNRVNALRSPPASAAQHIHQQPSVHSHPHPLLLSCRDSLSDANYADSLSDRVRIASATASAPTLSTQSDGRRLSGMMIGGGSASSNSSSSATAASSLHRWRGRDTTPALFDTSADRRHRREVRRCDERQPDTRRNHRNRDCLPC